MEGERTNTVFVKDQTNLTTVEKTASLFQPDTLLSAQYFETLRRKTLFEPEKRLMLAILDDAINCFQNNLSAKRGRGKRLFEEAEQWIVDGGGDWIFSFEHICETLGVNPEYLRRGLLQWKQRNQPKHRNSGARQRKKMTRESLSEYRVTTNNAQWARYPMASRLTS
jgi:hypothetical protein